MTQGSPVGLLPTGVTVYERGWLSSNNVLIQGSNSCALVDSGYCTHADQTVALIRHALGTRTLDLLVNTHLHSDHCGGNAALQQAYPAMRTLIPPGHATYVREWDPVALTYVPTGQSCPRFSLSGVLQPGRGSSLQLGDLMWQVHAAPGHDPHAVVLFEPQSRVLLSADALWQNGFGVVFPELEGAAAFDDVAATLDLIETLAPALIVPGHGNIFVDVAPAIALARRRLDAFICDPLKHASHAAKVLLKFKLLEQQRMIRTAYLDWAVNTHYFQIVQARYFPKMPIRLWIEDLTRGLISQGALAESAVDIRNV